MVQSGQALVMEIVASFESAWPSLAVKAKLSTPAKDPPGV